MGSPEARGRQPAQRGTAGAADLPDAGTRFRGAGDAAPAGGVRLERDGPCAWLVLDHPPANAFTQAMLVELGQSLRWAAADDGVRVVAITGAGGRFFCAGADLDEVERLEPADSRVFNRSFQEAFDEVAACPLPVVAAVNGMALGGGLELALACDVRLAADGVLLGLPEVSLGLIPAGGGTQRLPRLVGPGRAKELMMTGRRLEASEALALGLVDRVVAPDRLREAVGELTARIAAQPAAAVRAVKEAVDRGISLPWEAALRVELDLSVRCYRAADYRGAVAALRRRGSGGTKPGQAGT